MLIKVLAMKEVYTADPDIPEPSHIEVEIAIENLKKHKATRVDRIPSKLIQAGGGKLYKDIHKLIALIWNQKELPQEEKECIIAAIHKKGNRIDCNNCRGISRLSTSYKSASVVSGHRDPTIAVSNPDEVDGFFRT